MQSHYIISIIGRDGRRMSETAATLERAHAIVRKYRRGREYTIMANGQLVATGTTK